MSHDSVDFQTSRRKKIHKQEDEIVHRAKSLLGTAYKHLGRGKHGIDCLGVAMHSFDIDEDSIEEVARLRGLKGGYYHDRKWFRKKDAPDTVACCEGMAEFLTKRFVTVTMDQIRPGDLVVFEFKSNSLGIGDHLGIFVGKNTIVHAALRVGVVETRMESKLKGKIVGVFRYDN